MQRALTGRVPKSPAVGSRLDSAAWVARALEVLATRGIDGVRIEVLARDLKVTKGSFYWHFKDRVALLDAVLQEWRRRATLAIIDRLERTHEPAPERFHRLMRLQFDARRAEFGADVELAVRLWARHDAKAEQTLREIDELRLRYITGLLEELGLSKSAARARAILAYSYMRVSRTLVDPKSDRATIQACEAILSSCAQTSGTDIA